MNLPSIFDYKDYRQFIYDFYATQPGDFSYQDLAEYFGATKSYIYKIVIGQRPLNSTLIAHFAKTVGLSNSELTYLLLLFARDEAEDRKTQMFFTKHLKIARESKATKKKAKSRSRQKRRKRA